MMNFVFPEHFLWGAASSGPQSEGSFQKPHASVMDYWFQTRPQDFYDGAGPDQASDFYHRYREDLRLMKECGFNSFRTSIQWTRLIQNLETGAPDPDGVSFYNRLIEEAQALGIQLILNLHHFDLPEVLLEQYGGWESRHVVDLYVRFARTAFTLFGNRVSRWTTFNEPMVIAEAGYLDGFHWPKYKNRGKAAVQVMYHMALASALAVKAFHELVPDGSIGIILNLTPAYPKDAQAEHLAAARFVEQFYNRFFLDAAVKGSFPKELLKELRRQSVLFTASDDDLAAVSENTVDFIGVNYYHPRRVQARTDSWQEAEWSPNAYFCDYEMPNRRINPYRGWEIHPQAIGDIADVIKNEYNNIPWYLSENGMGVEHEARFMNEAGVICDDYRIAFYEEHLAQLHQAIQNGAACFGFHAWTAVDCWSWNNAYKNRYGFIALDRSTGSRTIKQSGRWFRKLADTNTLTLEDITL